ncbi:MAG TPA: peptidoglycan-binding domain-containing protein [Marmoricola sp.]|jgi:hypothetical protein|nr:peptidoglycan-binding domain-containing protein [Marmoricola sp.]
MGRRRTLGSAAAVVVALVVGGTAVAVVRRGPSDHASKRPAQEAMVAVARGDLEQSQTVTGELGYGTPVPVTGHGSGIITWLPSVGVAVRRGQQLYRVNDRPIALFYGDLPLFRPLAASGGADGKEPTGNDVDLVAQNLVALGFYSGSTHGAEFGPALADAVKAWQKSEGLDATGTLAADDVAVTPGPVQVSAVSAHLGDPAASEVLAVASTTKVVTLDAPVSLGQSLHPRQVVPVVLADGTRISTKVVRIGAATTPGDGSAPSLPVVVRPTAARALTHEPLGSVTATIVTASRHDVLHVPIAALLALAGGGYALEEAGHRLTPVRIGMVADDEVEVTGIAAGAEVVVAQ